MSTFEVYNFKERVTTFLTCIPDGSLILPTRYMKSSENLICFRNDGYSFHKQRYRSQKKRWVDYSRFDDWFEYWYGSVKTRSDLWLHIINNCGGHGAETNLFGSEFNFCLRDQRPNINTRPWSNMYWQGTLPFYPVSYVNSWNFETSVRRIWIPRIVAERIVWSAWRNSMYCRWRYEMFDVSSIKISRVTVLKSWIRS